MKKLVFSKEKFIEDFKIELDNPLVRESLETWVSYCDGKTREECGDKIVLHDDWMIEVDIENEPKTKKVFSKNKFVKCSLERGTDKDLIIISLITWADECEGKTREECEPKKILDDWLVEVDE